jgi:hypothetical protein
MAFSGKMDYLVNHLIGETRPEKWRSPCRAEAFIASSAVKKNLFLVFAIRASNSNVSAVKLSKVYAGLIGARK